MANVLEYAKIYQEGLDLVLEQEPTTAWMTLDNSRIEYNGGNEYKFAKLSLDGLADYSRADGFVEGDVTLEWETKKFLYDRGRQFHLDAMDYDETKFEASAPNILGEFARTKVIPEVDKLRIARVAENALTANVVDVVVDKENALEDFKKGIIAIREAGYDGRLVAHVTYEFMNVLELRMAGQLGAETFSINGVDTTFRTLDGVALIPTVSNRMNTTFTKNESGVFEPKGKDIAFLIAGMDVPHAIAKHESVRVFDPETNQKKNAWQMDYRLYHDCIILDNKKPAIYVGTKGTGSGE